jgi:hypothetical protein
MDDQDPSPRTAGPLRFSDHLLPVLRDAAVLGVETACDAEWEGESQLERVRAAVHMLDGLEARTCTREQVAALAGRAVTMQGDLLRSAVELDEAAWPTTLEETSGTLARVALARDLIVLRDEASDLKADEPT